MGYYVIVEGTLKVKEKLSKEEIKKIESIKYEKRDKTVFSVKVGEAESFISFPMDEVEGLTPFTDYVEGPLEKLLELLGCRIEGELSISSNSMEYDGALIIVSKGDYIIGDSSLAEASDTALKVELKKRGLLNDFGFLNLKPDLCSDINIDDENKGEVSVVMTGNIDQNFKLLFGIDTEYVDMYAIIDANTELVTRINIVATYENDKDYMDIAITNPAMQAQLFLNIKDADTSGKFAKVLEEARTLFCSKKMELIGSCVDDLEDFLSEQQVILPRSKESQDEGEKGGCDLTTGEEFYVSIHGEDYDALSEIFERRLGISNEQNNIKWFNAYYALASQLESGIDEVDFVDMALKCGITSDIVYKATNGNKDVVKWFETIANEHGLL